MSEKAYLELTDKNETRRLMLPKQNTLIGRAPAGLRNVTATAPSRIWSPSFRRWVLMGFSLTKVPLTLELSSMKYCSPWR